MMGHPQRIEGTSYLYYISSVGINGQKLFIDDEGRFFFKQIEQTAERLEKQINEFILDEIQINQANILVQSRIEQNSSG